MKSVVGLGIIIAIVWFVATVQRRDSGTVQALSGGSSQVAMREVDTPAGKLKLMGCAQSIADNTGTVEIKCYDSAESGTVIDTNDRVIYQLFRRNSKRTVSEFNMGFIHSQARSSSFSIVDFQIVPGTDRPKSPPTANNKKPAAAGAPLSLQ